ncbi:hypothetical protein [Caenibacillus caldisaponilyticus]|uniref:hypothetical protein n=1 Tax=Caenibacillus caldisaponilyticus TaxID=1674942 RepID=UPI001300DF7C|nr:hypothetical protein [Caenibacillus caldisaponilyticus]
MYYYNLHRVFTSFDGISGDYEKNKEGDKKILLIPREVMSNPTIILNNRIITIDEIALF